MSKRIYLALPANDDTPDWQHQTQFLMLLELNADVLQQLAANYDQVASLTENPNLTTVNYNLQGTFTPMGEEREDTERILATLTANTDLQITHGNFEDLLETKEGFVIFTISSDPTDHFELNSETYANEMRVCPIGNLAFDFGGVLETFKKNSWTTTEVFTRADITLIRELYTQNS